MGSAPRAHRHVDTVSVTVGNSGVGKAVKVVVVLQVALRVSVCVKRVCAHME